MASCKPCAQCADTPPCAASCHSRPESWWPDDYPQHSSLYPDGYKCTSIPECLGCPACTGKPNILFIFVDDVALHHIVSPHLPPLKNINKLKKAGMTFTDAHSSPLCAPSRYIVLSGRLPFRGRRRSGAETSRNFSIQIWPNKHGLWSIFESLSLSNNCSFSILKISPLFLVRHMDIPWPRIAVHARTTLDRGFAQVRRLPHRHVREMVRTLGWLQLDAAIAKFG